MLHDLFIIGINGKTLGGLNTSASNCMFLNFIHLLVITEKHYDGNYFVMAFSHRLSTSCSTLWHLVLCNPSLAKSPLHHKSTPW